MPQRKCMTYLGNCLSNRITCLFNTRHENQVGPVKEASGSLRKPFLVLSMSCLLAWLLLAHINLSITHQ